MVYFGTVKDGKINLDRKRKLPEGLRVRIEPMATNETDPAYRLWDLAIDAGPRDLATEHDHYIYGTPKRSASRKKKASVRASKPGKRGR